MATEYPGNFQGFSLADILAETNNILEAAKPPKPGSFRIPLDPIPPTTSPSPIPRFDLEVVSNMKSKGLEIFEIGGRSLEELVQDNGLVLNIYYPFKARLSRLLQTSIPRTQIAVYRDPNEFFICGSQGLREMERDRMLRIQDFNLSNQFGGVRAAIPSLGQIVDCHRQMMNRFKVKATPFASHFDQPRYIPVSDNTTNTSILRVGNYTQEDGLQIDEVIRAKPQSRTWLAVVLLPRIPKQS